MIRIVFFLIICGLFAPLEAKSCTSLSDLEPLLGHWLVENKGQLTEEVWVRVSDKTYEGYGRVHSIRSEKVLSQETLRLVEMSGQIFYIAKVTHNAQPIAFGLKSCRAGQWVFENLEHDFPKRIQYDLHPDGSLNVDVSDAAEKGFQIVFKLKS